MVEVEHRPLGPLAQHQGAFVEACVEQAGCVGDERATTSEGRQSRRGPHQGGVMRKVRGGQTVWSETGGLRRQTHQ